jgi:cell division septation protein DedD
VIEERGIASEGRDESGPQINFARGLSPAIKRTGQAAGWAKNIMNKNLSRGLAVAIALIILLVALYYLSSGGGLKNTGPSPVTAPAPPAATAPARPEPPAPAPTIEPAGPPMGVAPTPEPKVTVLPPLEASQRFGILAGSYKKYQDAENMLSRLRKPGNPAFIQRDPRDLNLYQVWLGPFTSQSEAEDAAKSLGALLKKPLKIETIENPVPK